MIALRMLGLILVLALIGGKGETQAVNLNDEHDQEPAGSENSFSIQIPLGGGNIIKTESNVSPERRLSLEDFFLNNNNQRQQTQPAVQEPVTQFQVQQPDPNSLMLVRDAQFPSPTGGLISRLLLARRVLRLRRIARRLTFLPRLVGLGLRTALPRSQLSNPLAIFSSRIGEAYNPRDYVFGNKEFSYNNNASDVSQSAVNQNQLLQQSRGYSAAAQPYYDGLNDNSYDLDNSNIRGVENYENEDLNKQRDILNSLTNEQQLLLLQQLEKYQQQLNEFQQQLNQPNNNLNLQNYQNQVTDQQPVQYQQPQHKEQYAPNQQNKDLQQKHLQQQPSQLINEEQLQHIQQLHQQLVREQELQHQLQQLQLAQQAQNLNQHKNLASLEQKQNFQNQHTQQQSEQKSQTDAAQRTQASLNIGATAGGTAGIGPAGNTVGVGVNVGIRPPSVDIQVTNPVAPAVQPLPPLVNPVVPKPVNVVPKPVEQPLVPLGIFPKPILNLKGRLFFGAEMGKGAGIKSGVGR